MNQSHIRIGAIDILRALTMLLMIFVNDLWSLKGIPEWLEHVAADADGMGLADTVFPGFLFIVGMSIPFAIRNRRQKGENNRQISGHILLRSFALLLMGVFLVNGEYLNEVATGFSNGWWNVSACTGFILIWNNYPPAVSKSMQYILRGVGALILVALIVKYKGGEDGLAHFSTWWWGILGLIGWAYLVAALLFTWCNGKILVLALAWIFSLLLCSASHLGWLPQDGFLRQLISPVGEGAMIAFTIGGALASELFWQQRSRFSFSKLVGYCSIAALVLFVAGFLTRPLWGISKIRATPSWVLICSGIMLLAFLLIYWLVDIRQKGRWFNLIKPAGTETLLCYLIPYYAYALVQISQWWLPAGVLTGVVGLLKSLVFAVGVIVAAGWLSKNWVRLKL
jgi:heparan-alpha-glucosaminide N-acetyltransferase